VSGTLRTQVIPMIKEILSSLRASAVTRINSPVTGSFMIIWSIINWEFLLVILLNDQSIRETLTYLKTNHSDSQHLVLYPIAGTLTYLIFHPWVAYFYQKYSQAIANRRILAKLSSEEVVIEKKKTALSQQRDVVSLEAAIDLSRMDREAEIELAKGKSLFELERVKKEYEFELDSRKQEREIELRQRKVILDKEEARVELLRTKASGLKEINKEQRLADFWSWHRNEKN
jgi:hypothetical protein